MNIHNRTAATTAVVVLGDISNVRGSKAQHGPQQDPGNNKTLVVVYEFVGRSFLAVPQVEISADSAKLLTWTTGKLITSYKAIPKLQLIGICVADGARAPL